jgi:hypothetical protein
VQTPGERASLDTLQSGVESWAQLYLKYLDLAGHNQYTQAHDLMVDQIYPCCLRSRKLPTLFATARQNQEDGKTD